MRIVFGVFLLLHGFAHLAGVATSFRVRENALYNSTILGGTVDIGDNWTRILGVAWLLNALLFAVAGGGAITNQPWWLTLTVLVTATSLVLTLLETPEARIGALVNVGILAFVAMSRQHGWL